ncbi:hypothetical protein IFR05_003884 [Cadophora sp. M221]|nr:hypothetical protein IFR05_003884 [Cadophora sp. M221]
MVSSPGTEHVSSRERKTWRSLTLRNWVLALLLTAEIVLFCGIIVLYFLSLQRSGFVNIGTQSISSAAFSVKGAVERGRPLLWTFLPTLIFVLYRMFRESVISSLIVETPYMELRNTTRTRPTEVEKSVYLDYRTSLAMVAWYKAFKNQHRFLGTCMLLSFVVSLILVPLAARLFAESEELLPTNAMINQFSAYEPPLNMSRIDYAGLMDAVSASWIHNASYPSGTDGSFAFPRVSPAHDGQNYTITLDATSPQVSLDCQAISSLVTSTQIETDNIVRTEFSADDRGCSLSGDMLSGPGWSTYLGAFLESNCDSSAGTSRIYFFHTSYSSSSGQLTNSKLISCIPSYWNVTGTLDVVSNVGFTSRRVEVPAFSPETYSATELPAFARQQFESAVMNVLTINTGSEINSPNRVAELVARYMTAKGLERNETALMEAATLIFPAIYTMVNVRYFYQDLTSPIQQQGLLRIPENRLHIVPYASITMLAILGILMAETVYLIWYVAHHESILAEEPIGLVGAANLLHGSNLRNIMSSFHSDPDFDGRLQRPLPAPKRRTWLSTFFRFFQRKIIRRKKNVTKKNDEKIKNTDDRLLKRKCYVLRCEECPCLDIVVETGADSVHKLSCRHSTSVS